MTASSAEPPAQDADVWTFVRSKKRRPGRAQPPAPKPPPAETASSGALPTPTAATLTPSEIEAYHVRVRAQWLASPGCRRLDALLLARKPDAPVVAAVCLGIGTFDPDDGSWLRRRKTHVQLAAFETVVVALRQGRADREIRSVFQEPCFTASDKAFLAARGHEVVESPAGFDLVGADAFLYGVHLYSGVYAEAIAKHIPALFIGTGWDVWQDHAESEVKEWTRIKELDDLCDKAKFPEDDEFYPAFDVTTIHWRRPTEPRDGAETPSARETLEEPSDIDKAQAALEKLTV